MTTDYVSFQAEYCENCGQLHSASDGIAENVDEPVHRIHILDALGGVENIWVTETCAVEERECECTGQVVSRFYAVGDVPDSGYDQDEIPDEYIAGRDPDEDALIDFAPVGGDWEEVREVPGIEDGGSLE